MFASSGGVNHAANLTAIDNQDLNVLLGTRISDIMIMQTRRKLAANLFLDIDSSVDLCRSITYLCQDHSDLPSMGDSAIDGSVPEGQYAPPKTVTFNGYCKGGYKSKLSTEQMECIQQSEILNQWYNSQLATAMENGINAIMARFYRNMLNGAHPSNTGNSAGMSGGGQVLGTPANPVLFDPTNADKAITALLETIKQMPKSSVVDNEFGQSTENAYLFTHQSVEQVLMQTDQYMSYDKVGDCASCAVFSDVFTHKPRGLMPITSYCVETRTCVNGNTPVTIVPVLFGRRNQGAKASIRVNNINWMTPDQQTMYNQTVFYYHMHIYDCRSIGRAWWAVKSEQPATITGCK